MNLPDDAYVYRIKYSGPTLSPRRAKTAQNAPYPYKLATQGAVNISSRSDSIIDNF